MRRRGNKKIENKLLTQINTAKMKRPMDLIIKKPFIENEVEENEDS